MKLPSEAPVQVQKDAAQVQPSAPVEVIRELTDRAEENPRRRRSTQFAGLKLGVDVSKLTDAGYYCHWVNDQDDRIHERLADGYQFVLYSEIELAPAVGATSADMGNKVSRIVGEKKEGGPLHAYLMKLRKQWKMENDAESQLRPDAIDRQIRQGIAAQAEGDDSPRNAFYDAGTSYKQPRSR